MDNNLFQKLRVIFYKSLQFDFGDVVTARLKACLVCPNKIKAIITNKKEVKIYAHAITSKQLFKLISTFNFANNLTFKEVSMSIPTSTTPTTPSVFGNIEFFSLFCEGE
jgi:hypothetical protein